MLRRGEFAVTAELNPPDSADPQDVYDRAAVFEGWVDAINAVDASGANCHMSSVGICALLTRMGYAPVMQIACRDRNRIAIQGDVLGAAAMGVANMLCLTGDGVQAGDQPGAKPVFDLDSISLLETVRTMRDEARFLSGRKITSPPHVFLGAGGQPLRAALRVPRRSVWPRRSPPARSSCRRSTASTCRCSRPSCARCATSASHEKCFILVRRRPARLGQDGALDPLQRAGHPHPRRRHRAARRRAGPEARGQEALHRDHPASAARSRASPACTSWPTGRRSSSPRSCDESGVLAGPPAVAARGEPRRRRWSPSGSSATARRHHSTAGRQERPRTNARVVTGP